MPCLDYNSSEASAVVLRIYMLPITVGSCSMTWVLGYCPTINIQILRVYVHVVTQVHTHKENPEFPCSSSRSGGIFPWFRFWTCIFCYFKAKQSDTDLSQEN